MGLDSVELVMAYEEAFGVRFADEDVGRMRTPRDVIDYVASRVPGRSRDEIAQIVRTITLDQLGAIDYDEDARFVEDFGVD